MDPLSLSRPFKVTSRATFRSRDNSCSIMCSRGCMNGALGRRVSAPYLGSSLCVRLHNSAVLYCPVVFLGSSRRFRLTNQAALHVSNCILGSFLLPSCRPGSTRQVQLDNQAALHEFSLTGQQCIGSDAMGQPVT